MATKETGHEGAARGCAEAAGPAVRIAAGLDNAPRDPEQTLLHRVIREQRGAFLARARGTDTGVPHFVEQ